MKQKSDVTQEDSNHPGPNPGVTNFMTEEPGEWSVNTKISKLIKDPNSGSSQCIDWPPDWKEDDLDDLSEGSGMELRGVDQKDNRGDYQDGDTDASEDA